MNLEAERRAKREETVRQMVSSPSGVAALAGLVSGPRTGAVGGNIGEAGSSNTWNQVG